MRDPLARHCLVEHIVMNRIRPDAFLQKIQEYVAITAIGASTLRNQGAPGVVENARRFLADMNLECFVDLDKSQFKARLDHETENLLKVLPVSGRPWGTARKALNLFLREVLYNRYLCERFSFQHLESWLEIPLDSAVARGLKKKTGKGALPIWPGLKHLTKDQSDEFQSFAQRLADQMGIARVHLDAYLWTEYR